MKRVAISEIAEINPRLPVSFRADDARRVSFLAMADVSEGGFVATYQERRLQDVVKGYTYFGRGDVLSAKITPCMQNGKAAVTDPMPHEIGFGSTEFHVLRPGPEITGRYLFHMIWSPYYRRSAERSFTGTAGQQRVPTDFFDRFMIPLPPLSEQKRIAGILDKADALRRKRQQALQLTEQFLRSTFLDMFGDIPAKRSAYSFGPVRPYVSAQSGKSSKLCCPRDQLAFLSLVATGSMVGQRSRSSMNR